MKRIFQFIVFTLFLLLTLSLAASEILTNETIITMVKAGLGEELIISKIKTSKNQFDTSIETIMKLRKEGVSENIIKTMVEVSASTGSTEQQPRQSINSFASFLGLPPNIAINSSSLYVKKGDKAMEIPPIIAEISHSMKKHFIPYYFGTGDNWHYIRGEKSVVRLDDKKPIFYTKANPSSFLLVKLSYQSSKDIRFVISTGGVYKNTIPLEFNKKSDDFFELFSKEELSPGEYAFVNSMTFYDFGID